MPEFNSLRGIRALFLAGVSIVKRAIYPFLPGAMRIQGRTYFSNYLLDLSNRALGRFDAELPPKHLNISGDGPFRELGEHNLTLCRDLAGLNTEDTVLDLGCGIGRTALAMKNFLSAGGCVGVDVVKFAIDWCKKRIGRKFPKFSFIHIDVYNKPYNPSGKGSPDKYLFPWPPEHFTFCLATSLFTHLLPEAAENYVTEVSRLLAPNGRFLSSWFLLHTDQSSEMAPSEGTRGFSYQFEHHAQRSLYAPEQAVAFRLDYVIALLTRAGFTINHLLWWMVGKK